MDWEIAKKRAQCIQRIRHFFELKGIIEVETPILSNATNTDPFIESFMCNYDSAFGSKLFLQTSPEFAMKRLLSQGYGSIFQLCKAFRNEEAGRYHNPEFTMLEWYRIGFDLHDLMSEVDELLREILNCEIADKSTYQETFQTILGIDPLTCGIARLKEVLAKNNVRGDWIEAEKDKDTLLQVLFSECIEKKIGQSRPFFVYNYPSTQASLAKINKDDSRIAERFECYFKGVELANGFNELTDEKEQSERFAKDNLKRASLGLAQQKVDQNFLEALAVGLPDCSGVALGIDRLLMLKLGKNSIKEVMPFIITSA